MNLHNLLLIGMIPLVLYSCRNHTADKSLAKDFPESRQVTACDSVNLETYGILSPLYLAAGDDSLWIAGEGTSSSMLFLLTDRGELVAKGVHIGNGPGEVLEVTSLHRVGNRTYLYDGRGGKVCEVQRRDTVLYAVPLDIQKRLCDDLVPLSDNAYLVLPVTQAYSYALADKNGKLTDSLSYYPAKPDGVSDFTHALACVGTLAVEENGKHFARALAYDGGIDFFGVDNGRLLHISRYERFGMDYDVLDVGQQVPTLSPTTRVGFSDLAVSTRRYYVLYSEELAVDNPTKETCTVCSFDMEGRPLCLYQLDRRISAMTVMPDEDLLLAIGHATEQEESVYLFTYDINE